MSQVKNPGEQETFTSKLDIRLVTPSIYDEMIELARTSPRTAVCAIGMPGLGKSAVPKQVAKRRKAPYIALHIPQMSIEDWHVPTMAPDTRQYYDRRIPRKFQEILEFVQKTKEENDGKFPDGRQPIIAVEEINRAKDKHVTQSAFTLLEDRMVGDTYIDDCIQLVVTMNPAGGSMAVSEFERDPAARRRLLMLGVTASYSDFMQYATKAKWHEKVIEHLEAQPTFMYDEEGLHSGRVFACPASWETVSQVCFAIDKAKVKIDGVAAQALIAGKIGATAAEAFIEFCKDKTIVITPDEVLQGYFPTSNVRQRFKRFVDESRNDKIAMLLPGLAMKIFANTGRKPEAYGKQLALFMEDLPEEQMVAFVKIHLKGQADTATNGAQYFRALSDYMSREASFHVAVERLHRAQAKAQEEANKSGV